MKAIVSRVVAALAAMLAGFFASAGIELAPEHIQGLEIFLEGLTMGLMLVVYGILHPMIEKVKGKLPADTGG